MPTHATVRAAHWASWLVAALLGLLALAPRLIDVDRFLTTDEVFWMGRTGNFARALASGQLGQTFQSGHPGVTTMWTALLGMGPAQAGDLAGARRIVSRRGVSQNPTFMDGLPQARRAFGVVTAAGVALAVLLAWRLFGPGLGLDAHPGPDGEGRERQQEKEMGPRGPDAGHDYLNSASR